MSENPKKIAIVSYNWIGDGEYKNGVMKADGVEVHIAQSGLDSVLSKVLGMEEEVQARQVLSRELLQSLSLDEMDHVYLYVGTVGGEEMIRKSAGVDPSKLSYVMCKCGMDYKKHLVSSIGNRGAEIIPCECGGMATLERILKSHIPDKGESIN